MRRLSSRGRQRGAVTSVRYLETEEHSLSRNLSRRVCLFPTETHTDTTEKNTNQERQQNKGGHVLVESIPTDQSVSGCCHAPFLLQVEDSAEKR